MAEDSDGRDSPGSDPEAFMANFLDGFDPAAAASSDDEDSDSCLEARFKHRPGHRGWVPSKLGAATAGLPRRGSASNSDLAAPAVVRSRGQRILFLTVLFVTARHPLTHPPTHPPPATLRSLS